MDRHTQLIAKADIFYHYFRSDANAEARRLYREAIKLNPLLSQPFAELAYAELTAWLYNWDPSMTSLDDTLVHAQTAISNEGSDYFSVWVLADVHLYRREFDKAKNTYDVVLAMAKEQAIPEEERAIHVDWADMLLLTGDAKQAISIITSAIDSNPVVEKWFYWVLGWAYYVDGQYGKSLEALHHISNPRDAMRKNVIANLVALNQLDQASSNARLFLQEQQAQGIAYSQSGGPVWPAMEKIEDRVPFQDDKQLALWKQHLEAAFSKQVAP